MGISVPHGSSHDSIGGDRGGGRHLAPRASSGAGGSSISASAAGSCCCCPRGFGLKATASDAQSGARTGSWVFRLDAAAAARKGCGCQVVSLGAPSRGKGFWAITLDTPTGRGF